MAIRRRNPEHETFWRDVLRRHAASGLSIHAFCAQERLAQAAFGDWRRVIGQRDADRRLASPAVPAFVPAVVLEELQPEPAADCSTASHFAADLSAADILIELRGGRVMRLSGSTAAGRLAAIVHAIEGASAEEGA